MRSSLLLSLASLALCVATACATGAGAANGDDLPDAAGDDASGDDGGSGDDSPSIDRDGAQLDAGNVDASPGSDATSGSDSAADTSTGDGGGGQKPAQGEVLITEVMFNPSGTEPDDEWFELHNTTASPKTLDGLTLTDGAARTHTIGAGVTIAPNAYVVFARLRAAAIAAQVPSASILYEYGAGLGSGSGIILANGSSGGVKLSDGATTIATAPYGAFALTAVGKTIELKVLTYAAESTAASWCVAATAWASGADLGTPGLGGDCP